MCTLLRSAPPISTPLLSSALLHPSPNPFFQITGQDDPAGLERVMYSLHPARCGFNPASLFCLETRRGGNGWKRKKTLDTESRSKRLLHLEYWFAEAYLICWSRRKGYGNELFVIKDSPGKLKNDSYQLWSTETDIPLTFTIPWSCYFYYPTCQKWQLVSELEAGFKPWPVQTRAWRLTTLRKEKWRWAEYCNMRNCWNEKLIITPKL